MRGQLIGFLLAIIIPAIGSFFKGVSNYSSIVFSFLKFIMPKIIKWGFFLFLFSFGSSLFIFVAYHVVYGSAVGISQIITVKTLNIMIYSTIGVFGYMAYVFLFKDL